MKLLMENWREYMTEEEGQPKVKFSGILKLMPSADIVSQAQEALNKLPEKVEVPWQPGSSASPVPLAPENFHVTLAHQSVLKPYKKLLKQMGKENKLPEPPPVQLDLSEPPQMKVAEDLQRMSWVANVANQQDMRDYVNLIMEMIGGSPNPEPERVFHVSLANLTGNPGDSVK